MRSYDRIERSKLIGVAGAPHCMDPPLDPLLLVRELLAVAATLDSMEERCPGIDAELHQLVLEHLRPGSCLAEAHFERASARTGVIDHGKQA